MRQPRVAFMSVWRRRYLDFRIWLGLKLFEQPTNPGVQQPGCYYVSFVVDVDFGQCINMKSSANAAEAMRWLSHCSTIPVPTVYGAWLRHGTYFDPEDTVYCCVLVSVIPGETLWNAHKKITTQNLDEVVHQLGDYLQQLRRFPQPPSFQGRVCSFLGGAMEDPDLANCEYVGPFTPSKYVEHMLGVFIRDRESKEDRFRAVLTKANELGFVLSHGDLHPSNIMVAKTGKNDTWVLSGIIDWDTCGWFPVYWEAFKARPFDWPSKWWREHIPKFAGQFPEELAIVKELNSINLR